MSDETFVWVVESGDYEDRHVDFVAATPEAAVAALKAYYGPPYVVRWDDLTCGGDDEDGDPRWEITAHFESVVGSSTEHAEHFDITRWKLHQ